MEAWVIVLSGRETRWVKGRAWMTAEWGGTRRSGKGHSSSECDGAEWHEGEQALVSVRCRGQALWESWIFSF